MEGKAIADDEETIVATALCVEELEGVESAFVAEIATDGKVEEDSG